MIQIAFYKGTKPGFAGLFNRLVRWWTRGPYSHCEIIFNTSNDGQSHCASASNIDKGVRFKTMALAPEKWDFLSVDLDPRVVAKWFVDHDGAKYDVRGLFGFVWRRSEDDRGKYFCSEACAEALGLEEAWRFDPNTLFVAIKRIAV